MAIYYVRPAGTVNTSGIYDGTSYANAFAGWTSITGGLPGAGGIVYICGAHTYSVNITLGGTNGTLGSEAVFRGDYESDPGSITLTSTAGFLPSRSHYKFINVNFIGASGTNQIYIGHSSSYPTFGKNLTFDGCTFDGVWVLLDGSATNSFLSELNFLNCNFKNTPYGIRYRGPFSGSANILCGIENVVVQNCTFTDITLAGTTSSAIEMRLLGAPYNSTTSYINNVLITNNTFKRIGQSTSGGYALRIDSVTPSASQSNSFGMVITNNTFDTIGFLTGSPVDGGNLVSGFGIKAGIQNRFQYNNVNNVIGAVGGLNLFYSTNFLVADNTIDNISTNTIDGNGILIDHGNTNFIVTRNKISNCKGNLDSSTGCGIMVLDSSGFVYGNIITKCNNGLLVSTNSTNDYAGSNLIANNIFSYISGVGLWINSISNFCKTKISNNIFHSIGPLYKIKDVSNRSGIVIDRNIFNGFGVSYTGVNQGTSANLNELASDPLLDSNYKPLPGSPCLKAGTFVGYYSDATGRPFSIPPSIGAYEDYSVQQDNYTE